MFLVQLCTGNFGLPPSSISRFIDKRYGGDSLKPTVMLTDYNEGILIDKMYSGFAL